MAVSKVGLGWPVGERDYNTLALWLTAKKATGVFEEALCSGDLGTSFVSITSGDFSAGALIHGGVPYDGSNGTSLPKLRIKFDIASSSGRVVAEDLWVEHTGGTQNSLLVTAGNLANRCYVTHTGNTGTNSAILNVQGTGRASNCVVRALNSANIYALRGANTANITNCVSIGGTYPVASSWPATIIKDTYSVALAETALCYNFPNGQNAASTQLASTDATGDVGFTGFDPETTFVDFANGDYRIRATSPLHGLGIGAFFETSSTIYDATFAVTVSPAINVSHDKTGSGQYSAEVVGQSSLWATKTAQSLVSINTSPVIAVSALKNGGVQSTLGAAVNSTLPANKVGAAIPSLQAVAAVSVYAGTTTVIDATFSVSASAVMAVQSSKVASAKASFTCAASIAVAALKEATGLVAITLATHAGIESTKIGQGSSITGAGSAIDLVGVKAGAVTVAVFASAQLSVLGNNPAQIIPAHILSVASSSNYRHAISTLSRREFKHRGNSRFNYHLYSGGSIV